MRLIELEIAVAKARLEEARQFYVEHLGFDGKGRSGVVFGESELRLVASETGAEPFYHFALLLPGDRADAARDWLGDRVALLRAGDNGDETFDFPDWNALAWYCHDPAGNIVEFIAHRDLETNGRRGPFVAAETIGLSEVGLVCTDKRQVAEMLTKELGLSVWTGELGEPSRLAFVGERARTLILSPVGRGWLPTGRPAEVHPARVVVAARPSGATVSFDSQQVVGRLPSE